jgi:CDP-glucose 4,6-dehydratase
MRRPDPAVWRGRSVFVTGHNGFKGAWLVVALDALGARVHGYSLADGAARSGFGPMRCGDALAGETLADIRDASRLESALADARPSVVFHLAAQAIVAEGLRDPVGTFTSNVTGTLNVLEAARRCATVAAVVAVTSDKVYRNDGGGRAFREDDPLGGTDPYSASKAAAELAIGAWRESLGRDGPPVCAARAGNVIGGGDFGAGRIVPDIARSLANGHPLSVRNPDSTRPFQYVGDVLRGYLLAAERLLERGGDMPPALNFGPRGRESTVGALLGDWQACAGRPVAWRHEPVPALRESSRLALDSTLAASTLDWQPEFDLRSGVGRCVAWYERWLDGRPMAGFGRDEAAAWLGLRPGE